MTSMRCLLLLLGWPRTKRRELNYQSTKKTLRIK
jgi:hypothetical protein